MTTNSRLEPIYRLRTAGSRAIAYIFFGFAFILAIIIAVEDGVTKLYTGAGFIVGAIIWGYVWNFRPHLRVDAEGVTNVGPFSQSLLTWEDFAGPRVEWGLRLTPRSGSDLGEISVHAFPATGLWGRKNAGGHIDLYPSGTYDLSTSTRNVHAFLADCIDYFSSNGGVRRYPATSYRATNWVTISLTAIAAGAFLANVYVILG